MLYEVITHHFDNKARATSLKVLEFNMRSDSIEDLPFKVGATLTRDQVDVLELDESRALIRLTGVKSEISDKVIEHRIERKNQSDA